MAGFQEASLASYRRVRSLHARQRDYCAASSQPSPARAPAERGPALSYLFVRGRRFGAQEQRLRTPPYQVVQSQRERRHPLAEILAQRRGERCALPFMCLHQLTAQICAFLFGVAPLDPLTS
jgi:hypothetical protein